LVIGACVDRTEQILAERALRASEARFRGIFEHAGTGIAIKDLEGRFQSCNPAYIAMLGYSEEELRAHACADLMHPDDHADEMLQQKRLIGGDIGAFEHGTRYFNKAGEMLWTHRHVSLLRDGAGRPSNIIVLVTDITQHKRHEERIHLLMQEVNHRSKNMLTVVHAIARQTAATKPDDFVERFGERVRALAASQDLLVKNDWMGVGLGALVRAQLAHFKDLIGSRIELSGPSLVISAAAAQTLGMALHELATNAGKYGALSNRDGQVKVAWRVTPGEPAEQKFTMSWSELGGPRVEPPAREGFGSTVIRRMAMESLNAEVTLDYPAAGFSWRLECPAGEIT
jgi:PAS domain S-box-containing protein